MRERGIKTVERKRGKTEREREREREREPFLSKKFLLKRIV